MVGGEQGEGLSPPANKAVASGAQEPRAAAAYEDERKVLATALDKGEVDQPALKNSPIFRTAHRRK